MNVHSDPVNEPQARERRERAGAELPSLRRETKDVLQQLQSNIQHVEDLSGRLGFVLTEVRGLIRR